MSSVKWISHRGYHEVFPENSLSAFKAAVDLGFKALETDLQVTADGHIVLAHDSTLARVSANSDDINSLCRMQCEHIKLKKGESLLFFEDFVSEFKDCSWTLDIKPYHGWETLSSLYHWSRENRLYDFIQENSRFLLWNSEQEIACKNYFPQAKFYQQQWQCYSACISAVTGLGTGRFISKDGVYALPPVFGRIDLNKKRIYKRYFQNNAKIISYLPRFDRETRVAIELGASEVLTNGKILM